jgi:hypothetical protein
MLAGDITYVSIGNVPSIIRARACQGHYSNPDGNRGLLQSSDEDDDADDVRCRP